MTTFFERLKEERLRLGLSQPAFGELVGVGKPAQIRYEKGERSPDSDYLQAAAAAGCDVLYLLTGRREPKAGERSPSDDVFDLALQAVQEWQVEAGKPLPVDRFFRAIELLVELADGEPQQVKKHAASVLRLAA